MGEPVGTGRRWARARPAVVAGAALLVLLTVVLVRDGGEVRADVTEHVQLRTVLGPLTKDGTVTQEFVARADRLSSVSARIGTFGGVGRCTVGARLLLDGEVVGTDERPCGGIPDSSPIAVLRIPAQADSEGRTYELELSLAESGGDEVTVWAGEPRGDDPPPNARVDGEEVPHVVEIHTGYDEPGTVLGQLGLALRRLADYRPGWQQPWTVVVTALGALAALVALTVVRGRRAVAVLIAFVVLKGLFWSMLVPPLEAPDEPAHAAYAEFMAEFGRIPQRGVPQLGAPNIYSEALTDSIAFTHQEAALDGDRPDRGTADAERAYRALADASPRSNGTGAAAGYPPAYYLPLAPLYLVTPGPLIHKLAVMRFWSIALGAVIAYLVLLAGRRLFPDHEGASIALAVAVSAQPLMSQQLAVVNNDALVVAGGIAVLVVALHLVRPYPERSRWLMFLGGAAVGIAVLGKQFGVVYLPVLAVAWLVGTIRTPAADRPSAAREIASAAGGVAATYGLWVVVSVLGGFKPAAFGDLPKTSEATSLADFIHVMKKDQFLAVRTNWVEQLWASFSWVDTPLAVWMQRTILVALLAGIVLAAVWLVRAVRARKLDPETVHGGLCLLAVGLTFVMLIAIGYLGFRQSGTNDLVQGRYALLIIPPMLAFPAIALARRLSPVHVTTVIAAAMVGLNVAAVAAVADHFYL